MSLYKNRVANVLAVVMLSCFFNSCKTSSGAADQKLIDDNTFLLSGISGDKSYGYLVEDPVLVGTGNKTDGPKNELRYLNALTGPNGEPVHYKRTGKCCVFKTKSDPEVYGRLSKYQVYQEGKTDTVTLFLNMYDPGKMKAPQGFGFKK